MEMGYEISTVKSNMMQLMRGFTRLILGVKAREMKNISHYLKSTGITVECRVGVVP